MFQLTAEEASNLKSQSVTSSWGGARRALPYAFTEHGAMMLASVLNSPQAVQMSVHVVRAFVRFGRLMLEQGCAKLRRSLIRSGELRGCRMFIRI